MAEQERKQNKASELWTILKYFGEELQKENITPARFFKQADVNHTEVLNITDLKEHIKKTLPESFDGLSYKKLMQALDQKDRGYIDLQDFVSLMDESIKKDLDTRNISKVPQMLNKNAAKKFSQGLAKKQAEAMKGKLIKKWDMVLKDDIISPEEMVNYVQNLIDVESRV